MGRCANGCYQQHFSKETVQKIIHDRPPNHPQFPLTQTQGFFCHSFVSPPGIEKPKVTIVATTRALQRRWSSASACAGAADGGFKFNLLGWPLHVIGVVNPAGEFGLCALGMTSTMQKEHVKEMFEGFRDSTAQSTKSNSALSRWWAAHEPQILANTEDAPYVDANLDSDAMMISQGTSIRHASRNTLIDAKGIPRSLRL